MKDPNPLSDQNSAPDDVATLYSWANLHGAKYRDFSAARAQTREKARLRAEQAVEEQRQAAPEPAASEPQADLAAEDAHGVAPEFPHQVDREPAIQTEDETERKAEQQAELAAEVAVRQAEPAEQLAVAQQAAEQAEKFEADEAAQNAAQESAALAALKAEQQVSRQRTWQQQPLAGRFPAMPASQFPEPFSGQPQFSPSPLDHLATPEVPEFAGRPAWLSTDARETPSPLMPQFGLPPVAPVFSQTLSLSPQAQTLLPAAPVDTLQGSRDRLNSRWFALRGLFDGNTVSAELLPIPVFSRPPAMAVFSLAGGVGKTSLVATLGRALSARGERVLLVDTAAFGLLPFFFGATDQRPGVLRTFTPPSGSSDAPIQMVTIDPEGQSAEQQAQESLSGEISKFARDAGRVIIDLATASSATTRRIMRMAPLVLVPVIADMNSVVSVSSIDSFFEHNSSTSGKAALPYYVLNQFDASLPLHLDVREVLREQLGERLLPFALRRAPAMSEALAEGMTVVDYAPGSTLAEDFNTLAGWVKSLSAPATTNYRGVRWSER